MSKSRQTPEGVRAVQERRRAGGHGLHKDRRTRRIRTRAAAVQRALRDA
jgi:hypothetical protein